MDELNEDVRPVIVSTLNFVDLAGSERTSLSAKEDAFEKIRQTEVQNTKPIAKGPTLS